MQATAKDVQDILTNHSLDVINQLGVRHNDVQLEMPLTGNPRIKVCVHPAKLASYNLPKQIQFNLNGKPVDIDLEVSDDFQIYNLHCS